MHKALSRSCKFARVAALALITFACGAGRMDVAPTPASRVATVSGPIDPVRFAVERVLGARDLAFLRSLAVAELGDVVYGLLYKGDVDVASVASVSQAEHQAAFLNRPRATSQGGWIYMRGSAGDAQGDLVRLYFDLKPEGAVPLADWVAAALDGGTIKYEFKVPASIAAFNRSSAAVLYVERGDYARAKVVAIAFGASHPEMLREVVPTFTKRIAFGIGAADEPALSPVPSTRPAHSHATVRTDAMAEAIHAASPTATTTDLVAQVRARLRHYAIDPDRPWLRQGKTVDDL